MRRQDLQALLAFNTWANERVLSAAERLTEEQLTRPLGSSFPTIGATLAHLAGAEWIWLRRLKGESPAAAPEWTREPTLETLRRHLQEIQTERTAYLEGVRDEDLERPVPFRYLSGAEGRHSLREILLHLVNHSTYHRGQVASMLRLVDATPPATDMLIFFAETGTAPAA